MEKKFKVGDYVWIYWQEEDYDIEKMTVTDVVETPLGEIQYLLKGLVVPRKTVRLCSRVFGAKDDAKEAAKWACTRRYNRIMRNLEEA